MRVRSFAAQLVLMFRQTKQNHGGNSQPGDLAAFFHNLIHGLLVDARHRADFLAHVRSGTSEHRIDHAAHAQPRFAHEPTQSLVAPQTPRPVNGKCHAFLTIYFCRWKYFAIASAKPAEDESFASIATRAPASRNARVVVEPIVANCTRSDSAANS